MLNINFQESSRQNGLRVSGTYIRVTNFWQWKDFLCKNDVQDSFDQESTTLFQKISGNK